MKNWNGSRRRLAMAAALTLLANGTFASGSLAAPGAVPLEARSGSAASSAPCPPVVKPPVPKIKEFAKKIFGDPQQASPFGAFPVEDSPAELDQQSCAAAGTDPIEEGPETSCVVLPGLDGIDDTCEKWSATYNWTGAVHPGWDFPTAGIAVSPGSNRTYQTETAWAVRAGCTETGGCARVVTVARDPDGTKLWEAVYAGTAGKVTGMEAADVETSRDGKVVYVAVTQDVQFRNPPVKSAFGLVAYDAATGAQLWTGSYSQPGNPVFSAAWAVSLALSPDGRQIYVAGGLYTRNSDAGNQNDWDYLTVGFDATTGNTLWSARYDGPAGPPPDDVVDQEAVSEVDVSPDGTRVYVTGVSGGTQTGTAGSSDPWDFGFYHALDFATIAYNAVPPENPGDPELGAPLWVARSDRAGLLDSPMGGLKVSPDGAMLFVTGVSATGAIQGTTGEWTNYAWETIAYDAATGREVWHRQRSVTGADGDGYFNVARALALSPDGDTLYVTGKVDGTVRDTARRARLDRLSIVAYDAKTGDQRWASEYAASLASEAYGVEVSGDGRSVYIAGETDPTGLFIANGSSIIAVAFDASDGTQLWAARDDPSGSEMFQSAGLHRLKLTYGAPNKHTALSEDGTLYVSGYHWNREELPRVVDGQQANWSDMELMAYEAAPAAPRPEPSPSPTGSPTPSPSPTEPDPSPSPTPTESPSPTPTDSPATSPTPSPTENPTPAPTNPPAYPEQPNDPYFGPGEPIDPLGIIDDPLDTFWFGTQWGPQKIGANLAWQEARATGLGVRVAVLDSGVDLGHPDLACSGKLEVVAGSDVVANDSVPNDENGHGTHVAGIIGACTNNDTGIAGVAPDATIVPIRVLNAAGSGTEAQIIAGIDRAIAAGAEVINMSLGVEIVISQVLEFPEFDAALERASAAGVVVIAAAGNRPFPICNYPALAEDVVCVGATDARDNRSWYSTFADKPSGPTVVAPGGAGTPYCDIDSEEILSLYARSIDGEEGNCDGRLGYTDLNGTSMAAPHVAGVAALVYDRLGGERSAANAQQVIDALTSTAVDLGPEGYDPVYGSGRVDALEAVLAVETVDPDPTSTPTDEPSSTPTAEPSSTPTTEPSPTPTGEPSPTPTGEPSPTPTDDPTTDPGPTTPAAPSNLTARAASSSRIELAWADSSNNETGFTIERSLNGNSWQEIASAGRNSTFHLDMGLNPDTSYFYRVRALNPTGYSGYSNSASATTMRYEAPGSSPNQAPAAPANLNASSSSPSRIDLSWSDSSNNEDGFALERSADGNSWQEIATTGRNQTSYLDSGLAANTTYRYRARAYNSAGHSGYSQTAAATTRPAPSGGGGGGGEPSPSPTQSSSPPVDPTVVGTATTSIAASRGLTTYKNGVELSGVVERDQNCAGPLEVEISRRVHGTNSYEVVASTAVNGAGDWGLQVIGKRNASYIAEVERTDTCQGEPSTPTDVLVKAKIARLRVPPRCDGPVRGKVRPSYQGTTVTLERRTRRGWKQIDADRLNRKSKFALRSNKCAVHRVVWSEEGTANEPTKQRFRL